MAVLISNGENGQKSMQTASPNTVYIDLTVHIHTSVVTNNDGLGEFLCQASSVSVWIPQ